MRAEARPRYQSRYQSAPARSELSATQRRSWAGSEPRPPGAAGFESHPRSRPNARAHRAFARSEYQSRYQLPPVSDLDAASEAIERARARLRDVPARELDDQQKSIRRRVSDHLRDAANLAAGRPLAAYSEVRQALTHLDQLSGTSLPSHHRAALGEATTSLYAAEDALEPYTRRV